MAPGVLPHQARRISAVRVDGKVHTLDVAPSKKGGFCYQWSNFVGSCRADRHDQSRRHIRGRRPWRVARGGHWRRAARRQAVPAVGLPAADGAGEGGLVETDAVVRLARRRRRPDRSLDRARAWRRYLLLDGPAKRLQQRRSPGSRHDPTFGGTRLPGGGKHVNLCCTVSKKIARVVVRFADGDRIELTPKSAISSGRSPPGITRPATD
jgi:hypothetical protein